MAAANDFDKTWDRLSVEKSLAADLDLQETIRPLDAEGSEVDVTTSHSLRAAGSLPAIALREEDGSSSGENTPDLEVLRLIGEGGMGRVHLAYQRSLARDVAVKRALESASAEQAAELRDEALVTSQLGHPSIVPVYALGKGPDGRPMIVMKHVEGVSWQALLSDADHRGWADRQPDPERRQAWHLETLVDVCNAVAFAHSRGFVHRDIKPDNVISGEYGEVYLMDWGLAARVGDTATSEEQAVAGVTLVGTPVDMAPEVVTGEAVDERTDVYLLGATLHRVLTGRSRHKGDSLRAVLESAYFSKPVAYGDEVPAELAELCNRATSRDRDARPASALAFRDALASYLDHRSAIALCSSADRRLARIAELAASLAGEDAVGRPEGEADRSVELRRLISECRFAYMQALAEWPDSPTARRGLQACLEALVRLELAEGNVAAARDALTELPEARADLSRDVDALAQRLESERAERERLREMVQDIDPRVAAAPRSSAMVLAFVALLAFLGAALYLALGARGSPTSALGLRGGVVVVSGLIVLAFRRAMLVTTFNRRFVGWFMALPASMLALRAVCLALRLPAPAAYTLDILVAGLFCGVGAVLLFRWLWLAALISAVAMFAALRWPASAQLLFLVDAAAVMAVIAGIAWRTSRLSGDIP